MGLFTWNDANLLGVRLLDIEHQTLFVLADELNEAIAHGENARTQKNHLNRLLQTLTTHFEHEEGLMRHYRYPYVEEHAEEHSAFLSRMMQMKRRLDAGAITLPLDSLQSVKTWFDRHIRRQDQLVARHIRQHEMVGLGA